MSFSSLVHLATEITISSFTVLSLAPPTSRFFDPWHAGTWWPRPKLQKGPPGHPLQSWQPFFLDVLLFTRIWTLPSLVSVHHQAKTNKTVLSLGITTVQKLQRSFKATSRSRFLHLWANRTVSPAGHGNRPTKNAARLKAARPPRSEKTWVRPTAFFLRRWGRN